MSVELLSAPRGESDEDAQKKILSQAENDAFARIAEHEDIDTQAIIDDEKQKAVEAQQLAKLAELNEHLKDADDRRRGLKAIYKSELVDTMSDEEVESFISGRLAPAELEVESAPVELESAATPVELEAPATPEAEKNAELGTDAPKGFPTREQLAADLESEGPVKLGFWKKARLLAGAPGRAVWKGYSKLFESAAKRSDKYNAMTPEQQERLKKKTAIISTLSALAIGGAYFATKSEQIRDLLPGHEVKGHAVAAGAVESSDPKEHQGGESAVNTLAEQQRVHETQFIYSPEADPFNNPDKKEWNFRAALDTSSVEAATADLTEGWKHNPLQFATAMGALGMIPNDQTSIEGMAQQMLDSPKLFAANHAAAMDIVDSSNPHFVEGSYTAHGSYSMVANPNGTQQLAYSPNVVDPQMMLVFNTPNGPVANGCDCGQIGEVPVAAQQIVAQPQEQQQSYNYIGGSTYTPPASEYTPPEDTYTPPPKQPPQPPFNPPQPPQPPQPPIKPPEPPQPPQEHKGNAYPSNQWDTPLDSGVFMPTPAEVQTAVETVLGRDIGGGKHQEPIIDTITAPRASETAGQMTEGTRPTIDTTPNKTGPATVQAPESTKTETVEVTSTL